MFSIGLIASIGGGGAVRGESGGVVVCAFAGEQRRVVAHAVSGARRRKSGEIILQTTYGAFCV